MLNKKELTEKIMAGRKQLDAALARVDNERMPLIVLQGKWSVKDLLAHLGFWEERVVSLFQTLRAGKTPDAAPDLDSLNAQVLTSSRKQSVEEIRRQEQKAYQKVLTVVREASDAELFDAAHFAWTEGRPFCDLIADNTYNHYEEHLPSVLAWLKRIS
ncbi:MAG: ClbS/DfsB family four-helix bundle protein [Anaerolineales bacterium]|nr:ClbS/DfsB family four-helix bundle protein [Anaerolineales bacterium]